MIGRIFGYLVQKGGIFECRYRDGRGRRRRGIEGIREETMVRVTRAISVDWGDELNVRF